MRIIDRFSFAGAEDLLLARNPNELQEIEDAIAAIDGRSCYVKESEEPDKGTVFSPIAFNHCFLRLQLYQAGWVPRSLSISQYFETMGKERKGSLAMDGLKNRVGIESQLGKYSFLEYDVLLKMPIYRNRGIIDVGIEILPSYRLMKDMSSGPGDFERLVRNLTYRGSGSSDCPVLVIGVDLDLTDAPHHFKPVVFDGSIPSKRKGGRPGPK